MWPGSPSPRCHAIAYVFLPSRVVSFFPGFSLCSSLLHELLLHSSPSSRNSFTWPSSPFSPLQSSVSIFVPACHLPPSLQLWCITEILKTPYICLYLQAFGVLFFLEYSFSHFPWTSPFRLPIANSYLALSSQLTWDHLLAADLVRGQLICPMTVQSSPVSEVFFKYPCIL